MRPSAYVDTMDVDVAKTPAQRAYDGGPSPTSVPRMTDNPPPPSRKPSGESPLLSPRSALILLLAVCSGVAVAALAMMAGRTLPEAGLAGLLTTGTSAIGFNTVIGP